MMRNGGKSLVALAMVASTFGMVEVGAAAPGDLAVVAVETAIDGGESQGPIGDFDGDSVNDRIYRTRAGALAVSPGRADGSFGAGIVSTYVGTGLGWVGFISRYGAVLPEAADLNGDGAIDVVLAELVCSGGPCFYGMARTVVAFNDGSGKFLSTTVITEDYFYDRGDSGRTLRLGDVDGDGDVDVVQRLNANAVPGGNTPVLTVEVRRNEGDGTFALPVNVGTLGSSVDATGYSLFVEDIDGDGTEDIVSATGGVVRALLAPDLASAYAGLPFAPRTLGAVPAGAGVAGVADLTGDGFLDVIVREPAAISIMPGAGGATFSARTVVVGGIGTGVGPLVVVDINVDGNPDLTFVETTMFVLGVALGDGVGGFAKATVVGLPTPSDSSLFILGVTDLGTGPHTLVLTRRDRVFSSSTVMTVRADLSSPDADGDGVEDVLQPPGTAAGEFRDVIVGSPDTVGSIVSVPVDLSVSVTDAIDPDGVTITVSGAGVGQAEVLVCGFGTLLLAAPSTVTITCGSVLVQVAAGTATLSLAGGVVVAVPAGGTARVDGGAGRYTVENLGAGAVTVTANMSGSTVEEGETATIEVDDTPPSISCPASPTPFLNETGATLVAGVADSGSGVAAATVSVALGTSVAGAQTVPVTARDGAGNTTTTTCSYRVVYRVQWVLPSGGVGAPQSVKRNTVVPFTFRLLDAQGRGATAASVSAPTSVAVPCSVQPMPLLASYSGSAVVTNLSSGLWIAGWKAEREWRGTCRRVAILLSDGTILLADVKVL